MFQNDLPDLIKIKYALEDSKTSPVLDVKQLINLLLEAVVTTIALKGTTHMDAAQKYVLSALRLLDEIGGCSISVLRGEYPP